MHLPLDETPWQHLLKPLREICLDLPEANATANFSERWFRAGKKVFATFGVHEGRPTLAFRAVPMARDELLEDGRFFPTPHMHHNGWLSVRLDGSVDWDEVEELVLDSYRQRALKRMLRALEA
jgi:predicted DNA-binding protein (MmcQ/YjbR family)